MENKYMYFFLIEKYLVHELIEKNIFNRML